MTEATGKTIVYHWLRLYCSYKTRTLLYYRIIKAKMAKYDLLKKFLVKKHCFGNKWQITTFFITRVSKTQVPHQFYHRGTAELDLCD